MIEIEGHEIKHESEYTTLIERKKTELRVI